MQAAVYGRDPNWGRIACAAGYAGIPFDPNQLRIHLGEFALMEAGQPLSFDRVGASSYLKAAGEVHGTVVINISVGNSTISSYQTIPTFLMFVCVHSGSNCSACVY
jgi:glutamate N-acetyltransferase/amino-acid N-acetyltransferase